MGRYYIIADIQRDAVGKEKDALPADGKIYAGCVKAVISADTWELAMEAGKRCITGGLKKGLTPFRWKWQDADFAARNGDAPIYDKYPTITWLTYHRVQHGLTQQQLADAAGINIRQIQRVELGEAEAGNLTARNLLAIADALDVDPRELI